MNSELAAIDASQSRAPQAGLNSAPGSVCRSAPFVADHELVRWMVSEFNVPIESPGPAKNQTHLYSS